MRGSLVCCFVLLDYITSQDLRFSEAKNTKYILWDDDILSILVNTLDAVNDIFKDFRLLIDKLRQYFSIERDICGFEFTHKLAVGESVQFDRFGDAGNPECTKIAFSQFPAGKCILSRVKRCLAGHFYKPALRHAVSSRRLEQLFMFSSTDNSSFYTHGISL